MDPQRFLTLDTQMSEQEELDGQIHVTLQKHNDDLGSAPTELDTASRAAYRRRRGRGLGNRQYTLPRTKAHHHPAYLWALPDAGIRVYSTIRNVAETATPKYYESVLHSNNATPDLGPVLNDLDTAPGKHIDARTDLPTSDAPRLARIHANSPRTDGHHRDETYCHREPRIFSGEAYCSPCPPAVDGPDLQRGRARSEDKMEVKKRGGRDEAECMLGGRNSESTPGWMTTTHADSPEAGRGAGRLVGIHDKRRQRGGVEGGEGEYDEDGAGGKKGASAARRWLAFPTLPPAISNAIIYRGKGKRREGRTNRVKMEPVEGGDGPSSPRETASPALTAHGCPSLTSTTLPPPPSLESKRSYRVARRRELGGSGDGSREHGMEGGEGSDLRGGGRSRSVRHRGKEAGIGAADLVERGRHGMGDGKKGKGAGRSAASLDAHDSIGWIVGTEESQYDCR
ncbi:hypothetical protein B0H11DRAFT_1913666 [Mycena galericulata]|nr:hypothetical protein B0H11DRAFT_1913666 [Mycena galericulata]